MLVCEDLSQMWEALFTQLLKPVGAHTVEVKGNRWNSAAGSGARGRHPEDSTHPPSTHCSGSICPI